MPKEQSFANHAKLDPPFHFFMAPVFLINFLMSVAALVRDPSFRTGWYVVLSAAAVVAVFKIRIYSLKVQDRVIRLEERIRLMQLLPATMHTQINEITPRQLVAIRFASDAEVPALVEKILSGQFKATKAIKQSIQTWRPDYFRV